MGVDDGSDRPSIVVLISGRGSNMRAIMDACKAGDIQANVVAVFSNKTNALGVEYAKAQGIDVHIIEHKKFEKRADFDREMALKISAYSPDLICLAGFMRILGAEFIAQFENKILNIHPSLLPKYKGLNTHQRAIDAGDNEAGCSVHVVTEDLDAGKILLQKRVPILANDTESTLSDRVLAVEHQAYINAIQKYFTLSK